MYAQAARNCNVLPDFDPIARPAVPRPELLDTFGSPYPLVESMRSLGIKLGTYVTLDDHLQSIISRAHVRRGMLARVAHCSWGLETSVLRVTYDALIEKYLALWAHHGPFVHAGRSDNEN